MVDVIAHRGVWSETITENSFAALSCALKQNHSVETDVRLTRDQQIVLSHDSDMGRLFGNSNLIGERNIEELSGLCSGEVFLQELRRYKSSLPILANLITRSNTIDRCILFADGPNTWAFSESCHLAFPALRTALHIRTLVDCEKAQALPCHALWLDEEAGTWITEQKLVDLKKGSSGIYLVSPEVWGSRLDQDDVEGLWQKWARWGIDGICSDWTELLQSVLIGKTTAREK